MDADSLFLRRHQQIASLSASHDHVDLLDLSDKLRQMLCDKHSLMDVVNTDRMKVKFCVGLFSFPVDEHTTFMSLEDGIDPDTRRPGAPSKLMSKDEFLGHTVVWLDGRGHSVKDVIGHARNVAGGSHFDPKTDREEYRYLAQLSSQLFVGGLPAGIRMLQAIGRVTARGLQPLVEAVSIRQAP